MQDEAYFVAKLELRHIKPTATRLLIVREMMRGDEAISLPELERLLPTIDKSTISRTQAHSRHRRWVGRTEIRHMCRRLRLHCARRAHALLLRTLPPHVLS